jgi:hypothetical protein
LIVTREEGDPAKGDQLSQREVEIVGQLLHLPDTGAKQSVFDRHAVYGADGKRHTVWDDAVIRVEVLDLASDDVILFAKCTGQADGPADFGTPKHGHAQCCLHEVHVSRALGRE